MRKKIEYLRLQIVSSFMWIPKIILVSIVLAIIVGMAAFAISSYKTEEKGSGLFKVAICYDKDENSKYIKQAVDLIADEDTVSAVCTFVEMDYDEAVRGLKDGNIDAVVKIPRGLISSIVNGQNKTIEVIFPSVGVNNSSYVYQEMLSAGTSVVSTAEAGIYSMDDVLLTLFSNNSAKQVALENKLSEIYFTYGLDRGIYFKLTDVSKTGGMSTIQFYLAAGLMLLLLFSGIVCEKLFVVDNNSMTKLLRIVDIKEGYISFAKILAISLVYSLIGLIVLLVLALVGIRMPIVYSFVEVNSILGFLRSAFALILLNFSILSFIYFIFTIINNTIYKVIGLFVIGIVCMYVSGCIIPTSLLPSLVRNIGYFLPTYYYFKLAGEFLTSNLSALIIIENLAISVVLMVISTYVLKLRVRKE